MSEIKSNLDSIFKRNTEVEKDGVWFVIGEEPHEISFRMKRFGGDNNHSLRAALAKHYKPYARLIENDTLPESKGHEISVKVFVDTCLTDWKGVEINGVQEAFSKEAAVKLLIALPELFDKLKVYASDRSNFREDVGN